MDFTNWYKIFASTLMDLLFFTYIVLFIFHGTTYRLVITISCSFGPRQALLNFGMQMARYSSGYMWLFPGMYALTVPYFDVNDFYFSGHIMTSTLFLIEYYRCGWY